MIFIQEQVDRESIAIAVKASKLTGKTLAFAFRAAGRGIAKVHHAGQTPKGRQPVKKLMKHNAATNTIPLDGDTKLFDRVARKWNVDYSFHQTGKDKYLLLFKSAQADAVTAAFSEYSALMMKRAKDIRPPIMERFKKAAEHAAKEMAKQKKHKRTKARVRNER